MDTNDPDSDSLNKSPFIENKTTLNKPTHFTTQQNLDANPRVLLIKFQLH